MKVFITFLISITCIVNIYSQRICEYGEHDFILNKIKEIDKSSFSKVKFLNREEKEPYYIYKYDSLARLTEVHFIGMDGEHLTKGVRNSCHDIYDSYYEYFDSEKPNKIKIKDNDVTHNAITTYDKRGNIKQIKYNNFISITPKIK